MLSTHEMERRAEADAQRAKDANEKKYQQFVEDSRRLGDRVSENLRHDEERAKQEEERRQERLDEEKRRQEQAESDRIEREMERHRRSLNIN
jgi:colicin import membrane protein